MSKSLQDLEPQLMWRHFAGLCGVPRPSKKEEKVRAHVLEWASSQGYQAKSDEVGTILVTVPATKGHEAAPVVVIQGHLDMVCEKNADVDFDFDTQPINAVVDGDWVHALGTTLGADNGIGVAMGMAAADDPKVEHGPLELLLTIDEETGMTGANNLAPGFVSGEMMVNLDSEEDGTLYVGCAGGGNCELTVPLTRTAPAAGAGAYQLKIAGLRGGHSGLDIHTNRGNALKLLARALRDIITAEGSALAIRSLSGGDKPNAIPRAAVADILLPKERQAAVEEILQKALAAARQQFAAIAPDLSIELTAQQGANSGEVFDEPSRDRIIDLLLALPDGVIAMSRELPGLVETSTNVARILTRDGDVGIRTSSRSSVAGALTDLKDRVRACCTLAGGQTEMIGGYPGWQPNMDSPLLGVTRAVFTDELGKEPKVTAIHAGLECGLIGEKYPSMDMISFGPEIENAHSPDERLHIASAGRCFQLLKVLLARLAKS